MSMDVVGMSLDEVAAKEGIRGRRRRGKGPGQRRGGRNGGEPVTSTQQRRKSIEQHTERAKTHREQRRSRRGGQDSEKPQYSSVVFGNGAPEKVLTGRLSESQIPKNGKDSQPVSLVQAALERGRELFMKKQARGRGKGRGKEAGGKRQSLPPEPRKRPVIQPRPSRRLRIVRPGDPGYQRQLRQLRDRTYAVSLVRNTQQQRKVKQQPPRRTQKIVSSSSRPANNSAPAQRLMGPESRRIALGMSRSAGSSVAGTLSDRFSSLSHK